MDRQLVEVDCVPLFDVILAGRVFDQPGAHVQHPLQYRGFVPGVTQTRWRVGVAQVSQQFADLPESRYGLLSHPQCHPLLGAEQVGQYGGGVSRGILEQQCGSACAQRAIGDFCHLEMRIHCLVNALEFAALLQSSDEVPEICVVHRVSACPSSSINGGTVHPGTGRGNVGSPGGWGFAVGLLALHRPEELFVGLGVLELIQQELDSGRVFHAV